jgi:hypothetical protein
VTARKHLLDRLEKLLRLEVKENRRERKEWREKLKALTDAQTRNREAIEKSYSAVYARSNSREDLAHHQAEIDERLNAFINTVERLVSERRKGEP